MSAPSVPSQFATPFPAPFDAATQNLLLQALAYPTPCVQPLNPLGAYSAYYEWLAYFQQLQEQQQQQLQEQQQQEQQHEQQQEQQRRYENQHAVLLQYQQRCDTLAASLAAREARVDELEQSAVALREELRVAREREEGHKRALAAGQQETRTKLQFLECKNAALEDALRALRDEKRQLQQERTRDEERRRDEEQSRAEAQRLARELEQDLERERRRATQAELQSAQLATQLKELKKRGVKLNRQLAKIRVNPEELGEVRAFVKRRQELDAQFQQLVDLQQRRAGTLDELRDGWGQLLRKLQRRWKDELVPELQARLQSYFHAHEEDKEEEEEEKENGAATSAPAPASEAVVHKLQELVDICSREFAAAADADEHATLVAHLKQELAEQVEFLALARKYPQKALATQQDVIAALTARVQALETL